jgi:hypothetical protein
MPTTKTTLYISYFIFHIFYLSACRPQVIEIDLPPHEPRLVVHCNWELEERQILWVWVGSTISILDSILLDSSGGGSTMPNAEANYAATQWVSNASVELYKDEQFVGLLTANPNTRTYRYTLPLGTSLTAGSVYELRISAPEYPSVYSSQSNIIMPQASNISYQPDAARNIDGERLDIIEIELPTDSSRAVRYYDIAAKKSARDSLWQETEYVYLESPDPNLENNIGRIIYKDIPNTASSNRLVLHTPLLDTTQYRLTLEIRSISPDYYKYYTSLGAYYASQGNPFAEPVVLFSNIDNGRGLFSLTGLQELVIVP